MSASVGRGMILVSFIINIISVSASVGRGMILVSFIINKRNKKTNTRNTRNMISGSITYEIRHASIIPQR